MRATVDMSRSSAFVRVLLALSARAVSKSALNERQADGRQTRPSRLEPTSNSSPNFSSGRGDGKNCGVATAIPCPVQLP